jgi:hypothetical protein
VLAFLMTVNAQGPMRAGMTPACIQLRQSGAMWQYCRRAMRPPAIEYIGRRAGTNRPGRAFAQIRVERARSGGAQPYGYSSNSEDLRRRRVGRLACAWQRGQNLFTIKAVNANKAVNAAGLFLRTA